MTDKEALVRMLNRAGIKYEIDPNGDIDFVVSAGIGGSADSWAMTAFDKNGNLKMIAWND